MLKVKFYPLRPGTAEIGDLYISLESNSTNAGQLGVVYFVDETSFSYTIIPVTGSHCGGAHDFFSRSGLQPSRGMLIKKKRKSFELYADERTVDSLCEKIIFEKEPIQSKP